jgi:hypothetical protein
MEEYGKEDMSPDFSRRSLPPNMAADQQCAWEDKIQRTYPDQEGIDAMR